ncbi:MAG: single-stranded-DNA-specific exonuclease RecJ [Gammaproteobacteria bacterium]|nr:single-stranded-DNA-specific exonuclease RecJ [Gammaproteobacteria bacterium]
MNDVSTLTPPIVRRQAEAVQHDLPADLHPLLTRVYLSRQLTQARQLEQSLSALLPFHDLKDIDKAALLLVEAIQQQRRIVIVADFDADGATSCALAIRALRMMGARNVDFTVPNRFVYGYGLTPEIVRATLDKYPQLIITVDNGISSNEGVAFAKQQGIQVVITDHHLPGKYLPNADAIVNPNQPGCGFASKSIAGVGVIFYVMLAVRARLRQLSWFSQTGLADPRLASLLDLVALGTVADMVALDHNNRIIVAQGLARIRARQTLPGIVALFAVAGRDPPRATTTDIGFCIAPRLNAAGRLEDMRIGIDCLLTDDAPTAMRLAQQLDTLNRERRDIEADMREEALAYIHQYTRADASTALPYGVCLFNPNWHEGVIGIVAGRLKDKLHRPVIVFAPSQQGGLKGSARSIAGLHIRDTLDTIAARHPQLLQKFGGHAMAAGISLHAQDFDEFARIFDATVREQVDEADLHNVVISDGDLDPRFISLPVAELLRAAGPWGQGFPEPCFDGEFEVVNSRVVGEKHLKFTLRPPGVTPLVDAIYFNPAEPRALAAATRVHIAYRLDVNDYQGQQSVQLMIQYLQCVE